MASFRSVVESDGGIVILAVVHPFCFSWLVLAGELMSVELSNEILCGRSAERSSGVDVADEHPLLLVGAANLHLHQVWTFPNTTVVAIFCAEVALVFPLLKILRRVDAHLLTSGKNHVPESSLSVPEDVWVAEVGHVGCNNGVVLIFCESLATVGAVSHRLRLACAGRSVESHNGIFSEACGIVFVNHATSAEDGSKGIGGDCCGFGIPMHEVGGCGVSPCHVLPL